MNYIPGKTSSIKRVYKQLTIPPCRSQRTNRPHHRADICRDSERRYRVRYFLFGVKLKLHTGSRKILGRSHGHGGLRVVSRQTYRAHNGGDSGRHFGRKEYITRHQTEEEA
jgi:hypothetical protein